MAPNSQGGKMKLPSNFIIGCDKWVGIEFTVLIYLIFKNT